MLSQAQQRQLYAPPPVRLRLSYRDRAGSRSGAAASPADVAADDHFAAAGDKRELLLRDDPPFDLDEAAAAADADESGFGLESAGDFKRGSSESGDQRRRKQRAQAADDFWAIEADPMRGALLVCFPQLRSRVLHCWRSQWLGT